ncbi:DUF6680 family protein [Burkholderia sp. BCC1644]|uniref:DUF6680 family protein n=1 Tax=Burkholderia sp. BCC1644 TaxID=2676293 RepID=UPI00326476E7
MLAVCAAAMRRCVQIRRRCFAPRDPSLIRQIDVEKTDSMSLHRTNDNPRAGKVNAEMTKGREENLPALRIWCRLQDSNPPPDDYKAVEIFKHYKHLGKHCVSKPADHIAFSALSDKAWRRIGNADDAGRTHCARLFIKPQNGIHMSQLGLTEYVMAGATLLGPVLAVQAQKWVERTREATNRKQMVFTTLMATRQSRVSIDHVRALNSIDLAFYGRRILGVPLRSRKAQAVLDAWHDYHAHLSVPLEQRPNTEAETREWNGRGDELFTNLLERLAAATAYKFDRQQLKSGSYSPEAHGTVELEQNLLRRFVLELLAGDRTLPLDVRTIQVDPDAAARQHDFQERVVTAQAEIAMKLGEAIDRLAPTRVNDNAHAER